jgi:hypothetical protein
MTELRIHPNGHYQFLPSGSAFSGGVAASSGYALERANFNSPPPLAEVFEHIRAHLERLGQPMTALCAVELRSPAVVGFSEFAAFNQTYIRLLHQHSLLLDGESPITRTNVVPALDAPATPLVHAFSYAVPAPELSGNFFVTAGAGELQDGDGEPRSRIVRAGEHDADAMAQKAAFVMEYLTQTLHNLSVTWSEVGGINLYTVQTLEPYLEPVVLEPLGEAARRGLHWYHARPPILEIEFEMDARRVAREVWL